MPIFSPDRHTCAPSYAKLTKQPITGGTYRPLANDEDSNACAPSALSDHHGSKLYTQKSAIHAISDNASVFIPKVDAPHLPKTTDDKSIDEAINEAANDSTHSAPPSTEIQLAQANEHPLMQAIEVCKQSVHTTAKALSTAGHAVAKAAKTTGHAIHTAATAVKTAWQTFANFKAIQLIIKFFQSTYPLWKKRHRFSYSFYAIIIAALSAFEVIFIQWGMYSEPEYEKGVEIDKTTRILDSVAGQTTKFVTQMWLEQKNLVLLNFIILIAIYLTLIFVLNRFWVSTAIFGAVMTTYAVANHVKMQTRNEPVLPADLNFITGGNTSELTSFIPKSSQGLVNSAVTGVTWLVIICIIMQFIDGRNGIIHCTWRRPFASVKNFTGTLTRIAAAVCSVALCFSFVWGFGNDGYWSTQFAQSMGDSPQIWNGLADSTSNGPVVNFLRLAHTKTMDKPEGYSQETMQAIAKKYAKQAQQINKTRNTNMTDNTVIMMLSETFSDPTRVPGVSFSEDPIPNIRQIKTQTTSGLMLSPGYGGGTANIEYQALTGLSMANYSPTLSIAYQQLVPSLKWAPTINQAWNAANGSKKASIALHAFNRNMYFRDLNYKKFQFSQFFATDGKPQLTGLHAIDSAWYVSDESFYSEVLKKVTDSNENRFYQVVTMQNHMPYEDLYQNNEFKEMDASDLPADEKLNLDTYTKGLNYTDQSTFVFLSQLNEINRPITVLFYGDHLPGFYSTAYSDKKNILGLHETDYFIWSNQASCSANTKLDAVSSDYTSSNYFSAQLAEHLNAKVSPYLAFLTEMHRVIPAMSVPDSSGSSSAPTYLDSNGNLIKKKNLSKQAKQLLHDYQLIQYDMSVGKNYLKDTGFVDLPK